MTIISAAKRALILAALGLPLGAMSAQAALPPTPLISREAPAYASSGEPAKACDFNYRTVWRGDAPGYLAYDLSASPESARHEVVVAWYSDSYDYDPTLKERPSYGLLKDYTIEINHAPGGKLPASGWEKVAAVTGNIYHSRQHAIDMQGANWVRISFSAVDNAGGSAASINMDVHDVSAGLLDDWIVFGDSVTAGSGNYSGSPYGPEGQLVAAANPDYYPIFECGGTGSIYSIDGLQNIDKWLAVFPGHYVGLAFGTNDSWGHNDGMDKFYDNTLQTVEKILAAGKVPVLAKIPWSTEPGVADNAPAYNEKVEALYKAEPRIVKGPDFWNIMQGHPEWLGPDGVHPSPKGYGVMRAEWAKVMLNEARTGKSAPLTEALAKAAWAKKSSPAPKEDKGDLTKGEELEIQLQQEKHHGK